MLLHELSKIAHYGARKPLSLWLPEYDRIRANFVSQAETISSELHNTHARESWEQFLKIMQAPEPQELHVVQALQTIADILSTVPNLAALPPKLIAFRDDTQQFAALARKTAAFAEKRKSLVNTLSIDEQRAYDLRLFQGEGMWYCLEYYLEFYKRLVAATTSEEKRMLIEPIEVKLGYIKIPGLWYDFFQYEELDKFIYLILDDHLRDTLIAAYFDTRNNLLTIHSSMEPDIPFRYDEVSIDELVYNLKRLIVILFNSFHTVGIHQLTSRTFTPYGFQPMIKDIKL